MTIDSRGDYTSPSFRYVTKGITMHPSLRRAAALHLLALVVALLVAPAAVRADDAQWKQLSEHWYIFELADARAGWMRETVESDGERYRTRVEMHMRMARMQAEASVRLTSTFIETHDGKPVLMSASQMMSAQNVETHYEFNDDGVELTTRGPRSVTRMLPLPEGQWFPPQALQRYLTERHEARPEVFTYRTIDPQNGIEPDTVTTRFLREDTYQLGDRAIPVTVWSSRTSSLPVDAIEMYSTDNVLVFWEADTGMGKMGMRLSTKADATNEDDLDVPELVVSAFARSDQPIDDHFNRRQLRYRLTVRNGELPQLPTAGAQRVVSADDKSAVLIVDIDDNVAVAADETESDDFRTASVLVDSDDPLVGKLTTRALRGAPDDPMTRAERLRAFVYDHITDKGMETAFAGAAETARTRTGDCSEHGVLLAAMLRADGVPSRVATGLLYVGESDGEGLFGWHMWTQGLIDGRWIDFDATLPVRYTAGHILTSTSSFADGSSSAELSSLLILMGNLDIEVLEFTTAGAAAQ